MNDRPKEIIRNNLQPTCRSLFVRKKHDNGRYTICAHAKNRYLFVYLNKSTFPGRND